MIRRGRWGALLLGTLAAAAALSTSAGAGLQPATHPAKIDVSTKAGIAKFLSKNGIDPKGIVIQRGTHNYAGPNCPGIGWTCTMSMRVLQVSQHHGDDSQFECTPSTGGSATSPGDCTIIQVSTGGTNDARCKERTRSTTASQRCVILQTNTTGDNLAEIEQRVDADGGPSQDATQYAGVIQETGGRGSNIVDINQDIEQTTSDTTAAGSQTQEGHQGVSVTQTSDTGANRAHVDQSLSQKATAMVMAVSQNQNANGSQGPNTNAGITQTSNTGKNRIRLNQSNDLDGKVGKQSNGSQTQGSPDGGLNGVFNQTSSGVSKIRGTQHEDQDLKVEGDCPGKGNDGKDGKDGKDGGKDAKGKKKPPPPPPNGVVTQTQYGPARWDPNQGTNPADVYRLRQDSEQHASNSTLQSNVVVAECFTTGNCDASQRVQQQGRNTRNSCSSSACSFGIIAVNGQSSTCGGPVNNESGGCDVSFPPPPPPPVRPGCEFDCNTLTPTTTTVTSSNPTTCCGFTVTFTATVSPSGVTGTVTFKDGTTTLCANVPLTPAEGGSQATCDAQFSSTPGTHPITATYSGDSTHAGSAGAMVETVTLG